MSAAHGSTSADITVRMHRVAEPRLLLDLIGVHFSWMSREGRLALVTMARRSPSGTDHMRDQARRAIAFLVSDRHSPDRVAGSPL